MCVEASTTERTVRRPRAPSRSPRARSTGRRARPGRSDSSSRRAPGPRPGRGRRARPPPQPDVPAQADAGNRQVHVAFERVEVRLPVLVEVADVLPVAVHRHAVGPSHLERGAGRAPSRSRRPVGRDVLEHLGLEDVDARVDRVGEDLTPRRLLEEALDSTVVVRDDDPELERVLDGLEADRDCRLVLVELDELAEVEVAQRVTGDDEERVVELVGRGRTEPAVPSGDSSTEYSMFSPSSRRPRSSCESPAAGRRR